MFRKLSILFLIFSTCRVFSMKLDKEVDLSGEWKFEIGDREEYARPEFNDEQWEKVYVPDSWENQGFPGYDGFAWYRKSFVVDKALKNRDLFLKLGKIDDVDMVYLNGQFIGGKGVLPPDYKTAYDASRVYKIPQRLLNYYGENVLAVRIFDNYSVGGIYAGKVGIYSRLDVVNLTIDLSGSWKFKYGDDINWKERNVDESDWADIKVPSYWEDEGYPNLDGYAWYRNKVNIDKRLADSKLIILLGKINDVDQIYFNGTLIGSTGIFDFLKEPKDIDNMKNQLRAYFIPPDLIETDKENVIAVRVFDTGHKGGIFEDYIGIVTRHEYLKYIKTIR